MRAHGMVLVGLLASAACGPDAAKDPLERTTHACLPGACVEASAPADAGDAGSGNAPLERWDDTNAGPRSGVFAALAVVGATVGGDPVTLRLLFRLRLLTTGPTTKQSTTLCAFQLPSAPGVATLSIPPLLQSVIQKESVVVAEGPFLSPSGNYAPPPFLLVLGAKLKDPMNDPLPSMTDLSGQWDEDHDGHPGVTIDATLLTCGTMEEELYVALRTGGTLAGSVVGLDTIEGTMDLFEEEVVLGYSAPCLSVAAGVAPRLTPKSPYRALRVADEAALHATGNVGCGDIVNRAHALFGSDWP